MPLPPRSLPPLLLLLLLLAPLPPARAVQANFHDATAEAGVAYVQSVEREPFECLLFQGFFCEPERMSGGAAVGDVDADGWPDLFVTRLGQSDRLFRNRGDGTFEDVTASSGLDAFVIDSNAAVFADVDRDGDADLYVTSIATRRFHLFINDGTGFFTEEARVRGAAVENDGAHVGFGLAVGDVNLDGYPDLVVGEWRPQFVDVGAVANTRLLVNRGDAAPGFFDDLPLGDPQASETFDFAPAILDLDRDGWPDIAIAGDFGTSQLYWNQGDGSFVEGALAAGVGTDENGMGSTFGDFDGDGTLDWFVTSIYDPADTCSTVECNWGNTGNRLYRGCGDRQFEDATDAAGVRDGAWGWGAAFFDPDNDGDEDLVMTNGVRFPDPAPDAAWEQDAMRFWRNAGDGTMTEMGAAVGLDDTGSGKGLLVFDYDRDGDQDLFVVNNPTGGLLLRNDGGNAADFVRVTLRGRASTTRGHGAVVLLRERKGQKPRMRVMGATSHFLGQSEPVVHFGLGPGSGLEEPIYKITVKWPSGEISRVYDVARRSHLMIVEPGPACGLLGLEPLLVLALARRRRLS